MTPDDILNKRFERATMGGYRADDVNAFMVAMADSFVERSENSKQHMKSLENDKMDLQNKLVILANKLEEYRVDEDSMRTALVGAQKLGDTIVKDSREKAESLLESAVNEADQIIKKANNDAKKISHTAQVGLEAETQALARTKREVSQFKKKMLSMYQQHIDSIGLLPETEEMPPLPEPLTTNIPRRAVDSIKEFTENRGASIAEELVPTEKEAEEEKRRYSEREASENRSSLKRELDKDFEPLQFGAGFRLANDE